MTARRLKSGVYPKSVLDFGKIYSKFISNLPKNTGSAMSFLGVARLESADGKRKIKSLYMESYKDHANPIFNKICKEVRRKYALTDIQIVHAVGNFRPGDPVVLVLVASSRRAQAYKALEEAVERYKKEPALFKKEIYVDGRSAWIY